MKHSESLANLGAALAQAQAEMKAAPMNSVNPFLKNKFADLGAVIETARPIFTKYGLSLAQFPVSDDNGKIGIENVLLHSSGEWMSETILMELGEEKGKSAAQVAGSIFSYFRRYSWASIAGMYADEDTDGNNPQGKGASQNSGQTEMTLEQAMNTMASDGKRYGERTTEELTFVANNPKSPADKKLAAQLILKDRASKGK